MKNVQNQPIGVLNSMHTMNENQVFLTNNINFQDDNEEHKLERASSKHINATNLSIFTEDVPFNTQIDRMVSQEATYKGNLKAKPKKLNKYRSTMQTLDITDKFKTTLHITNHSGYY